MNDERREHGAVDESFLEQQIHESDDHIYILILRKNWRASTSGTGSYVCQAIRRKSCSFRDFQNPVIQL